MAETATPGVVEVKEPSFPFGKPPFLLNHSKYSIGKSQINRPPNLPNGIFTVTICFSISGFGCKGQRK